MERTRARSPNHIPMSDLEPNPPKKPRIRSKQKGNGFEGTVAKKLSAALQPLNFIRTPGSGARVGGKNFETIGKLFGEDALKIFVGDVVPVNERQEKVQFLFSLECKFYASQDPFTSLVANTANLFKWFKEAVDDASKVDKQPMLVFKWNHTPIFVAVDASKRSAALAERSIAPRLTLTTHAPSDGQVSIDIYYLDDLLPVQEFWFKKI